MDRRKIAATLATAGGLSLMAAAPGAALGAEGTEAASTQATDQRVALREARALLRSRPASRRGRFTGRQNVFLPSTIRVRRLETPGRANATVPAFRGVGPNGRADVWYVITEAADYHVARAMGLNYAPKMVFGRGTPAARRSP